MERMVDRLGKTLRIGDCVRYWHRVDGKPTPEIGEIVSFSRTVRWGRFEATIERKFYNATNTSIRTSSGVTKISKSEGVLWKLEQFAMSEMD